ncbi:hypothetical protein [Verminephrobacter eiseniae]|uniref:hypothetical protein n=1 Tax=Verminephrobacter eiseniae TaxID=364317 RepID=UPI0022389BF6|nr:hypothetical protein [Verminephrobacter eiseniae]
MNRRRVFLISTLALAGLALVSRHRSSVGLRWPSKRIACQYARYGLRAAPCAALRWLRAAYDI